MLEFYPQFQTFTVCVYSVYRTVRIFFQCLGEEKCTMNVHILSLFVHMECVRNWGPIWCYSCFAFEPRNSDIKRLFHGSRVMSKQVCIYHFVHNHYTKLPTPDGFFLYLDARVCVPTSTWKKGFIQCIGLYMAILIGLGRCVHGLGIRSYI